MVTKTWYKFYFLVYKFVANKTSQLRKNSRNHGTWLKYWTLKTLYTSLEPGAQKLLRHKWRKLNTASFNSAVLMKKLYHLLEWVFHLCFRFQVEVSSYCTFTETFAIWFQKWFDHEQIVFVVFLWNLAFFVDFISARTELYMNCSGVLFFWRHQIFSMTSLRGVLVCSINVPTLFSYKFFSYRLMSFINVIQLYFLCQGVFHCVFCCRYRWNPY